MVLFENCDELPEYGCVVKEHMRITKYHHPDIIYRPYSFFRNLRN
jgi:hypothetical protein